MARWLMRRGGNFLKYVSFKWELKKKKKVTLTSALISYPMALPVIYSLG